MKIESCVKSSKICAYIFALIGFVFSIIALALNIYDANVRNSWIEEHGIITVIDDSKENIFVTYEYNGVEYVTKSSFYSSEFNLGDEVVIFINPDNLSKIYLSDADILFIIFHIVGGLLALIGIGFFVYSGKRKIFIDDCLNNGSKKTLKVIEFKKSYVYKNRQAYYFLKVLYNDKEYKSELFRINKDFDLTNLGIVDLYILENGKYYIDLKSYRKKEILDF